jgi:hypothetical protein
MLPNLDLRPRSAENCGESLTARRRREPPMSNPVRARGHKWQFVEGMFCLTVHGEDPEQSVAIPIGALLTLAADGRRRDRALHRRAVSAEDSASSESVAVNKEAVLPVQTWSVAPLDNGMLVLMLDRGLDTEMLLGLSPEIAETLADLFIKNAAAAQR